MTRGAGATRVALVLLAGWVGAAAVGCDNAEPESPHVHPYNNPAGVRLLGALAVMGDGVDELGAGVGGHGGKYAVVDRPPRSRQPND